MNKYSDDPRSPDQVGRDILADLSQQIRSAATKADTVVLSSEAWFFRPGFATNAEFLSFANDHFDDVECVCYVRQPSKYVMSALQQSLKASHELPKVVPPNYKSVFQRITPHFRLNVREFARDALEDGDVVKDFFSIF